MTPELEKTLLKALSAGLPGEPAQQLMAPLHRRAAVDPVLAQSYRPSAVMILLCEDERQQVFFPLIERMSYAGAHSAQIGLPGGKFEETDQALEQTAIRECTEEIGVERIRTLGKLTPLHIPVSEFTVHPFIGFCEENPPKFKPDTREVKSIIRFSPLELLDSGTVSAGRIQVSETISVNAPWFEVKGYQVWGATAMILSELREIWKKVI